MPTKTVERVDYDKAKTAARLAHTLAYRRADAAYRTAMEEALRAYAACPCGEEDTGRQGEG